MSAAEIALLAGLGLFAGIFGTLVGIGGGIFFVPVFLLILHLSPQQAIGTSLLAVFFNALSGSISYLRQKRVDIKAGWKFAVATVPGAIIGAWLAHFFTSQTLELVFGLLLLVVAPVIFFHPQRERDPEPDNGHTRTLVDSQNTVFRYSPREGAGIVISFFVGIISSLLGIGGGIIHVPVLMFALGFPAHIATATSHFILAISTFFGSASHLFLGDVLVVRAMIVAALVVPGAQIGAALSRRVKGRVITRLLAAALVLAGLRLLLTSLGVF